MEGLGIDGTAAIIMTLFVTGFVEMIKYMTERQWNKVALIAIAGVSGAVAGCCIGLGWLVGICGGFAASGLITVAKRFGDN